MEKTAIVTFVGRSGAGKTTLIERLIPELRGRGVRVGTVKHDVHGFEMDRPGKDSFRHKHAGAQVTVISSPNQIGIVMDVDHDHHPDELGVFFSEMDIVLTEGYKRQRRPKVEVGEAKAEELKRVITIPDETPRSWY